MTTAAWTQLRHSRAPELLEKAFGLQFSPASGDRELSLDELGRVARQSGFTISVRATTFPLDDEDAPAGPHLLLRGDRFLTVMSRGASWRLLDGNARVVRMRESDALRILCTDAEREALDRCLASLRNAGVSARLTHRLVRMLGMRRAGELADWLAARRESIRRPEAFARFAVANPDLLPKSWGNGADEFELREIAFDRQLHLETGGTLRSMAGSLIRSESSLMLSLIGLVIVAVPIGYIVPLCLAFLIDRARNVGDAPVIAFAVLGTTLVVGAVLGAVRSFGFLRLTARFRIRLLGAFLFRLLGCRIQDLRCLPDGDVSARLSDLFVAQQLLFGRTLPSVLSSLTLAGGLIYLGTAAPALFLPLGVAWAGVALAYGLIAPRLRELVRERLVTVSTWRERLIERFENWKLFRHLDPGGRLLSRIDPFLAGSVDLNQRGIVLGALLGWLTALVALGFLGVAWWIGVSGYHAGNYSLGQFLVLMGLALGAFRGFVGLTSLVSAWVRAEPSIRRLRELVARTEPESLSVCVCETGARACGGLEIDDVSFAWPNRRRVLDHVSVSVAPAEWVAVVGASGSGKSTLAYILGGLVEPSSGTFALGRQPHGSLHPDVMRRHVAVIPQEPTVFDATIRENVMAGLATVSEDAFNRAVEMSDLGALVGKRRRGVDELVGENGSQVSVGEKMRIALARALVRDPELLVLDETFGHLDEATTERIIRNLKQERLAVMLLTHDESLARHCDRAYALKEGRMVAMDRAD